MGEFFSANWFGIIGLILSIPIGIFANLSTPKFQAWWARRSAMSIQSRIKKIEKEMQQMNDIFSHPSIAVAAFAPLLALCLEDTMILIALVGITSFLTSQIPQSTRSFSSLFSDLSRVFVWFALSISTGTVATYFFLSPIFEVRRLADKVLHYQKWKEDRLKEMDELKSKLPPA